MICLDFSLFVMSFCRNEIVSLLSVNRRIGADLIADVIDQSADNLVDGVTAGINLHFQDMLWSDIKKIISKLYFKKSQFQLFFRPEFSDNIGL